MVDRRTHNHLVERGFKYTPWSEIDGAVYTNRIGPEFGIDVEVRFHDDTRQEPTVTVHMPHQCDAFNIVSGEQLEAHALLRRFIKEAQAASSLLARLDLDREPEEDL